MNQWAIRASTQPDRSVAASGKTASDIVKAVAAEKKAQGKLADASRTVRATLDALTEARRGAPLRRRHERQLVQQSMCSSWRRGS